MKQVKNYVFTMGKASNIEYHSAGCTKSKAKTKKQNREQREYTVFVFGGGSMQHIDTIFVFVVLCVAGTVVLYTHATH